MTLIRWCATMICLQVVIATIFYWTLIYCTQSIENGSHVATVCEQERDDIILPKEKQEKTLSKRFLKVVRSDIYVYSAYFDSRVKPSQVRIFGIATMTNPYIYCKMHYRDNTTDTVEAKVTVTLEHDPPYCHWKAAIVECDCGRSEAPHQVALTTIQDGYLNVILSVSQVGKIQPEDNTFVVCMNQLYNVNKQLSEPLVAFFEMIKILGATKVLVYDMYEDDISIRKLLDFYEEEGTVEQISFKVPMCSWHQGEKHFQNSSKQIAQMLGNKDGPNPLCIKNTAQSTILNDCVYRTMDKYKYSIMIDLDELVIPLTQGHTTWQDMMQEIFKNIPTSNMSASFAISNLDLCAQQGTKRGEFPIQIKYASRTGDLKASGYQYTEVKCVYRSEYVHSTDVHMISKAVNHQTRYVNVSHDIALRLHFRSRICSSPARPFMRQYFPKLKSNLQKIIKNLIEKNLYV